MSFSPVARSAAIALMLLPGLSQAVLGQDAIPLPAMYDGGNLVFQSADSAFKYWIDGRVQLDAAEYFGSENDLGSGTHVRRARFGVKTTMFRN